MQTSPVTPEQLNSSIIAVPPLARDANLKINRKENGKIIRHIEAGGVSSLLYGGNANFYHIAPSEYAEALEVISTECANDTLIVPSIGPTYGVMMDQMTTLRDFDFPTVMVLPMQGLTTDAGVAAGFRKFVEALGKPAVLYIKFEGYLEPETVAELVNDGLVSWIKYAIVREDPAQDDYLSRLIGLVDPRLIVSGIGEQPAITHLTKFQINGFTSGCVCVRPDLSQKMLTAINSGNLDLAEDIRGIFRPLEDLRNEINPIRVLHEAVAAAGIGQTGPALPLLSSLDPKDADRVGECARKLLTWNS
ncbi:dihydrodipicolinate synthase family protein [Akkermansiaceae bacterium]|jgi:dihydrodipicolinate synthase/N-acetylneuraminate lyase|nr:dihydrodipicolinate synthase family protein [Akkermansiaceae bacterium]MDB4393474.1 dihydrodipicolinate synthase family protein [bacterium]MDA7892283.1 dihydrodipicolinate synthase family protein [Akkermansiaceae bacterium]MDA7934655.1 dihydrodipicolinate synthase family protein [Akkermansiaceae bacterium]MDA9830854.1 dihydrodipicolinate synthase family protein [Akkermansiaceae bacterium]